MGQSEVKTESVANKKDEMSGNKKPLTIGVFGGSFNPVHLGHALLAITTQQTKTYIDHVVLVPVYKHAVKRNLLPFEDRVQMCKLAISSFGDALSVSTIEEKVGASNGEMLKALKLEYPPDTRFVWICGDDFIRWMHKPKGIETLSEVSGLIVQRRLHKEPSNEENESSFGSGNKFTQEPLDEDKIHRVAKQLDLDVDFIYGELPHFSSTLVRRAPGHWRSFLTQSVAEYLDERPHLLQQLIDSLTQEDTEGPPKKRHKVDSQQDSDTSSDTITRAATFVLQGLDVVHALQYERGRAGLYLSTGAWLSELVEAQKATDGQLKAVANAVNDDQLSLDSFPEISSLVSELQRVPEWLSSDRQILRNRGPSLSKRDDVDGWLSRLTLVEKFNARIDVLVGSTVRALIEIVEDQSTNQSRPVHATSSHHEMGELLLKWCEGKEALGRLRAFVCAGGPSSPTLIRKSLKLRESLNETITNKERCIDAVLSLQRGFAAKLSAPETLHKLLQDVTFWEYKLMGCFSSSTPLHLIHEFLGKYQEPTSLPNEQPSMIDDFKVEKFFEASTRTLDFLLTFAKALTASVCAIA